VAKIREIESGVYIPVSKAAKALGLVQSTHFSYQTPGGSKEEGNLASIADRKP